MKVVNINEMNARALQSRDMILTMFAQAWKEARAGKDTSYLSDIMESLKEYLVSNGSLGITQLDFSHGEYSVEQFEYTLVKLYRKCKKRFAEWTIVANEQLQATLNGMRIENSTSGYEDYIKQYHERFKVYTSVGYSIEQTRATIIEDIRKDINRYKHMKVFTMLACVTNEKDYRTLQALFTDVKQYCHKYDIPKALFALSDFKQMFENTVNRCEHMTKYERYCWTQLVPIGSHKDIKKKKADLKGGKYNQHMRAMMNEHLDATPYHERIKLKSFKKVKLSDRETETALRADMVKPKLESSFPKKRRKKANPAYKTFYTRKASPESIERLEKIALLRKKLGIKKIDGLRKNFKFSELPKNEVKILHNHAKPKATSCEYTTIATSKDIRFKNPKA